MIAWAGQWIELYPLGIEGVVMLLAGALGVWGARRATLLAELLRYLSVEVGELGRWHRDHLPDVQAHASRQQEVAAWDGARGLLAAGGEVFARSEGTSVVFWAPAVQSLVEAAAWSRVAALVATRRDSSRVAALAVAEAEDVARQVAAHALRVWNLSDLIGSKGTGRERALEVFEWLMTPVFDAPPPAVPVSSEQRCAAGGAACGETWFPPHYEGAGASGGHDFATCAEGDTAPTLPPPSPVFCYAADAADAALCGTPNAPTTPDRELVECHACQVELEAREGIWWVLPDGFDIAAAPRANPLKERLRLARGLLSYGWGEAAESLVWRRESARSVAFSVRAICAAPSGLQLSADPTHHEGSRFADLLDALAVAEESAIGFNGGDS